MMDAGPNILNDLPHDVTRQLYAYLQRTEISPPWDHSCLEEENKQTKKSSDATLEKKK